MYRRPIAYANNHFTVNAYWPSFLKRSRIILEITIIDVINTVL